MNGPATFDLMRYGQLIAHCVHNETWTFSRFGPVIACERCGTVLMWRPLPSFS